MPIQKTNLEFLTKRQTNNMVLNPEISPKQREARLTKTMSQSNDLHEIRLTQKEALWSKNILQGACPCLPPTTVVVLRHLPLPKIFNREHSLAYPPTTVVVLRHLPLPKIFHREHSLAYLQPQWWSRDIYLYQKYSTGSMPLLTPNQSVVPRPLPKIFYRELALAYPQPQWWS